MGAEAIAKGVIADTAINAVKGGLAEDAGSAAKGIIGGDEASNTLKFGSDVKSVEKLTSQMSQRGWNESLIKQAVDSPYITRASRNLATGNTATAYYMKDGGYIVVDDVTKEIVQISDKFDPNWKPDSNIINPYLP